MRILNLGIVLLLFKISALWASNYPTDYTQQKIHIQHYKSGLIAVVGSSCFRKVVIGYRSQAPLSSQRPDHIDAVLSYKCLDANSKSIRDKIKTIQLTPEWNQTGFMSYDLDLNDSGIHYCDENPLPNEFFITFSDGNSHWDPTDEEHLYFDLNALYKPSNTPINSPSYDCHQVGTESWKIITNAMKNLNQK